jgi:hypothetical protein
MEIAAIVGEIYRIIDMGSAPINCMEDMVCFTLFLRSLSTLSNHR